MGPLGDSEIALGSGPVLLGTRLTTFAQRRSEWTGLGVLVRMIQPVGRVRLRRPRLYTTPSGHVVGSGRIDASGSKRRALAVWRLLRFGTFEATAAP